MTKLCGVVPAKQSHSVLPVSYRWNPRPGLKFTAKHITYTVCRVTANQRFLGAEVINLPKDLAVLSRT